MKRFLAGVLALVQVILCAVGLRPVDRTVDYGGTPYMPPQIATAKSLR